MRIILIRQLVVDWDYMYVVVIQTSAIAYVEWLLKGRHVVFFCRPHGHWLTAVTLAAHNHRGGPAGHSEAQMEGVAGALFPSALVHPNRAPIAASQELSHIQMAASSVPLMLKLLASTEFCRAEAQRVVARCWTRRELEDMWIGDKVLISFTRWALARSADMMLLIITEELARNLQTSDISITSSLRQTELIMGRLTDLTIEEKFTELWEKVKRHGENLDLQPVSLPRVRQHLNPDQFLRQKYFAIIDIIKGEMESHFQHPGVTIYKAIENVLVKSSNGEVKNIRDQVLQICEHFKEDLNVERFTRQLAMLTEATAGRKINSVHDVLDSIRREQSQTRTLFSELCTCLKLLLVLPTTSATAERPFSTLRCLKTWLCSTMTHECLSHIAVLTVHRDLAKDVPNLDIANKFITSKESRKLVFGHIHV
ncbi:hypothetical protein PR048_013458 [Dryococelus australis]|uniref:HAT C-terminal dimerisation domain-containing protein n=1 Tax=Dryococelus australis TaxID=614101 RepID=A0ABQ9HTQ7_9NEOP|nr:hypothetical protein PR048_013458 [Dryococelus australis]